MKITEEMKNGTGIEGDIKLTKENLLKTIQGAKDEKYKYMGIVFNDKGVEYLSLFKSNNYDDLYKRIYANFDSELKGFPKGVEAMVSIEKFWVADDVNRICEILEF